MGGSVRRCRWYGCPVRVPDTVRYCSEHLVARRVNREAVKHVSPSKYDYGFTQARPGFCRWVEKTKQAGWKLVTLGGDQSGIPSAWWYECPARVFRTGDSFCAAHAAQAKATADSLAASPGMLAIADRVCAALDRMNALARQVESGGASPEGGG